MMLLNSNAGRLRLLLFLSAATLVASCLTTPSRFSGSWLEWSNPILQDPILLNLRAPRVMAAFIVGSSLGLSGFLTQRLLHNELSEPYLLGISGGAALGAVVSLFYWPEQSPGPSAALGGCAAAIIVMVIAKGTLDRSRLVLCGAGLGALFGSITGMILLLAPNEHMLRPSMFWLFGGLGYPDWSSLILPSSISILSLAWSRFYGNRFATLALGDDVAQTLGISIRKWQLQTWFVAVVLTASCVCLGGLIGFIGLIAPHIASRILLSAHASVWFASALVGGIILSAADLLARIAFAPREMPIGLLTTTIGGPFFLWILHRKAR